MQEKEILSKPQSKLTVEEFAGNSFLVLEKESVAPDSTALFKLRKRKDPKPNMCRRI